MSTEKPDPKNPAEPAKTTKLPDQEADISDEELEKATGGASMATIVTCGRSCGSVPTVGCFK